MSGGGPPPKFHETRDNLMAECRQTAPTDKGNCVLARQRQEAILREVDRIGGVRTPSDALAGPVADATLGSLHVDTLILGVHGIDPVAGLTTPNLIEATTNRVLIATARRVVSEQVGQLIVAQPFDSEADNKPRKAKSS
ncbi:MAG: hypothetical protein ACYDDW_11720 [Dermatophilaceae bacterium]